KLGPTAGLIMLAGIYYGAMYGGSTTSILVNVPGEAASVVTTIDGYRLARKGRAGAALAIAAIASFVAGTFSVVALQVAAPLVARAALAFGPAEYFALGLLGLVLLANLTGRSRAKSLAMVLLGVMLGPAATIASFVSYGVEKKVSKHRAELGSGAIEGVAGPEAANNAAAGGGMIPLLSLGLPFTPSTAVLLSGMLLMSVTPGPF